MFERARLNELDDYFTDCAHRAIKGTYFCRIVAYNDNVNKFLCKYLEEVKKSGVYLKGKIQNPDEKQLTYYNDIMGINFKLDRNFIDQSLKKWLPRLDSNQRQTLTEVLFSILYDLSRAGKNENMLKNTYIKFMCWFYYKFERILNQLGKDKLPKILYEGTISEYELKVLHILAKAGCDILLLEYDGDQGYLQIDKTSEYSDLIAIQGDRFPENYSIVQMQSTMQENQSSLKIDIQRPQLVINTNTWLTSDIFNDSLKAQSSRGTDKRFLYNMFVRVKGVEDKGLYYNELLKWKLKLESAGRSVLILEKNIQPPDVLEVQKIPRKNYLNRNQMILDMVENIVVQNNRELERYIRIAFHELMLEDNDISMQKLSNQAISILCWINRYIPKLFSSVDFTKLPTAVFYGTCNHLTEVYFMKLLSRIPVDVMILCPDKSLQCMLEDKLLFERTYENSLPLEKFPTQIDNVKFGTVAYHAEQDLNTIMYQDTGMYRDRQFKKAIPISLHITYEEISILWGQEAKYRPNFEILDDRVMLPVIFSKVSGVPKGKVAYWNDIEDLIKDDTFVISELPYIKRTDSNPIKQHVTNFISNGKLLTNKIKSHPSYQYSFMREEMQDYMLNRLQELIDRNVIKGTFTNGAMYTIVSTVLNLEKTILRMIQKFDFTKAVPKLIIINTNESICSLEDSIVVAYLNMLGFDIAIFIPTGYQSVEINYEQPMFIEHQVGEYIYDLNVPNFKMLRNQKESLTSKIFRRGRDK